MELTHNNIREIVKTIFNTKLNSLNDKFIKNKNLVLTKENVATKYEKKKNRENKKEQIKELPLIGESVYNMISKNRNNGSDRYKLILSLMDNLNLEYIDKSRMQQIIDNRDEIYEKYFCRDCEYEFSSRMSQLIVDGRLK